MNIMWSVLSTLINLIPPQLVKEIIDDVLDKLENHAASLPLDDPKGNAVLAGCSMVRRVADIPDDIGGDED